VLEEGSPNRALHILKSGRVRVSRKVQEREVTLCDLVVDQTFGELSIIEDGVASATLRAVTDTEILSISMHDLPTFLRTCPKPTPSSGAPSPSTSAAASSKPTTSSAATSK
jgi:CRP/FNR family transcriptional regulator